MTRSIRFCAIGSMAPLALLAACWDGSTPPSQVDDLKGGDDESAFVMAPYVQDVGTNSACVLWQGRTADKARVRFEPADGAAAPVEVRADAMAFGRACASGLVSGAEYGYRVILDTGSTESAISRFRTAREHYDQLAFAFIADTQTMHSAHENFIEPLNKLKPELILRGRPTIGHIAS